jgi:hypothetical protein
LSHVVTYLTTLPGDVRCDDVDENWVEAFRQWATRQPIITPTGKRKQRAPSTIENSVLQLAAVINHTFDRKRTGKEAHFRPAPTKDVNRTPGHRSDVAELAKMFRYAVDPNRKQRRIPLHRFLLISIATLARPDAAHGCASRADAAGHLPVRDGGWMGGCRAGDDAATYLRRHICADRAI